MLPISFKFEKVHLFVFRHLFHIPFSDFGGKYCQGKFVPMWVSDVLKHLSHHPLGKWKWYQRHWKERRTTQSRLISLCFLHIILIDIKWDHIVSKIELGRTHMGNINSENRKIYKVFFDGAAKTFDNFKKEKKTFLLLHNVNLSSCFFWDFPIGRTKFHYIIL